jgi:hypothetical protein
LPHTYHKGAHGVVDLERDRDAIFLFAIQGASMPTTNVGEIGGSIQDFLSQVRSAFETQFPPRKRADGLTSHYLWVRDIFENYVIVNDEEASQLYRVNMTKTAEGITFDARIKWEKVKLSYAKEMVGDSVITEFKGKRPEVSVRTGVDVAELTKGDGDPFFLTVEISTEGRVSKNGLLHDAELATTLVQQINSRAAEGIMGHIKEGDRSTAFPVSDIHWLGATRQDGSTWAKGYIPKTAVAQREHFRILMATNGRAATSITGPAVREFVDKSKGTWRAKDFQLEQLDLAPFTRAALPPESDFVITREMYVSQESDMTKDELLAALTAQDIPQPLRDQILREAQVPAGQVAELQQQITVRDDRLTVLETAVQEYQRREFETALDTRISELLNWEVKGDEAKKKLNAFRGILRSDILAELGQERKAEKVAEVVQAVWAKLQPLAETVRDALAGPPAIVGAKQRSERAKFEDTPEARQRARAEFSF